MCHFNNVVIYIYNNTCIYIYIINGRDIIDIELQARQKMCENIGFFIVKGMKRWRMHISC